MSVLQQQAMKIYLDWNLCTLNLGRMVTSVVSYMPPSLYSWGSSSELNTVPFSHFNDWVVPVNIFSWMVVTILTPTFWHSLCFSISKECHMGSFCLFINHVLQGTRSCYNLLVAVWSVCAVISQWSYELFDISH